MRFTIFTYQGNKKKKTPVLEMKLGKFVYRIIITFKQHVYEE